MARPQFRVPAPNAADAVGARPVVPPRTAPSWASTQRSITVPIVLRSAIAIPAGKAPGPVKVDVSTVSESMATPSERWTTIAGSRPAVTRIVRQPFPSNASDCAPSIRTAWSRK